MIEEKEQFKTEIQEFLKFGPKSERAVEAVLSGGVKEGLFLPSGRRILTVVGRLGDEFIDPGAPYCSCSNFFFRVTSGREELCYHLLAYQMASKTGKIEIVKFDDEEFPGYLSAAVRDIIRVIRESAH